MLGTQTVAISCLENSTSHVLMGDHEKYETNCPSQDIAISSWEQITFYIFVWRKWEILKHVALAQRVAISSLENIMLSYFVF